jgi:hypothetical protein
MLDHISGLSPWTYTIMAGFLVIVAMLLAALVREALRS